MGAAGRIERGRFYLAPRLQSLERNFQVLQVLTKSSLEIEPISFLFSTREYLLLLLLLLLDSRNGTNGSGKTGFHPRRSQVSIKLRHNWIREIYERSPPPRVKIVEGSARENRVKIPKIRGKWVEGVARRGERGRE